MILDALFFLPDHHNVHGGYASHLRLHGGNHSTCIPFHGELKSLISWVHTKFISLYLWLFHQVFWCHWHESNQYKEWFKKIEFPFLWPWSWVSNLTDKLNSLLLLSSLCTKKKKKQWQKKKSLFVFSLLQRIFLSLIQ